MHHRSTAGRMRHLAAICMVAASPLVAGSSALCQEALPEGTAVPSLAQDSATLLQFTSLAEFAGDSIAVAIMLRADADAAMLARTVDRLVSDARARLATGGAREAARRLQLAADLQPLLMELAGGGQEAAQRAASASAQYRRAASAAYESVGDSVHQGRILVTLAVGLGDIDLAVEAWRLVEKASSKDRVRALLALERGIRYTGNAAQADSLFLLACQAFCTAVTDDVAALAAALEIELRSGPGPFSDRPVQRAVREMVGEKELGHLTWAESSALGTTTGSAGSAVAEAVSALTAAGSAAGAAEVLHARAYMLLPERKFTGSVAYARSALDAAELALAHRQRAADPIAEARTLSLAALAYARMGQSDSARALLGASETLAQQGDSSVRALVRRRSAVVAATAGDTLQAERLVDEAASLRGANGSISRADDRHAVARALVVEGAAGSALRQASLAYPDLAAAGSSELAGRVATTLAEAHRLRGHTDSTARYFRIAADEFARVGMDDHAAQLLASLAEEVLEQGRLEEAEALLQEAVEAVRRWPWDSPGTRARILNDQGLVEFGRERWREARALFSAARAQAGPTHIEYMEAEENSALVDAAVAVDESNMSVIDGPGTSRSGTRFPVAITGLLQPPRATMRPLSTGWLYTFSGILALRRSELGSGYTSLRTALEMMQKTGHDPSLRRAQGGLATMFSQLGRPDSAAVYLRAAGNMTPPGSRSGRVAGGAGNDAREVETGDPARSGRADPSLSQLRENLAASRAATDRLEEARALEALGSHYLRRRSPADPATATEYFDSAFTVVQEVSDNSTTWSEAFASYADLPDWVLVQVAEQFTRLQEESVLAWLARAPEVGGRAAAAGAAAVADRSRSRAFDVLARRRGSRMVGIAADIFEAALHSGSLPEVGERLFNATLDYRRKPTTLSYLLANDTLVTWLGAPDDEKAGQIGELLVTRRGIARDSLYTLVTRARTAIASASDSTRDLATLEAVPPSSSRTAPESAERGLGVAAAATGSMDDILRTLAKLLLPEELVAAFPAGGEMLIVAGGAIAAIPFAALPLGPSGDPLSTRFSVRYAPSLASQNSLGRTEPIDVLPRAPATTDSVRASRRRWLDRAVVIGNPTMPLVERTDGEKRPLSQLPGAEAEARSVASMLGVEPLTGQEATLDSLRGRAAGATVVHLATHGFAYGTEDRVGDSFVALAPSNGEDGLLTVSEILGDSSIRFPAAELVVLSACQTGLGQLTLSEGTLGLQRAFLAAGARSMLVSLWSVSDEATAVLLRAFYRHWLEDPDVPSKAESLRRAQEDVRRSPGFGHPRFWAAFQLVGAG